MSGDGPLEHDAPTEIALPRDEGTEPLAPSAAPPLSPGNTVQARFRIVRLIARGGMGEVYEAVDTALGTRVALKTVRLDQAANERALQRFRREILLARKIGHPNVCRVFELHQGGPGEPAAFLTMELLEGETLADRLKRDGPLPEPVAKEIVRQILAALSAAHAEGVIHRDLKASNVMLVPVPGAVERVVVTDFGIAHAFGALADQTATLDGFVGTPAYMAPEQVTGSEVSPATDLYCLGVLMFEMTSGSLPFAGETPQEVAARRLSAPIPRLRSAAPGVSRHWAALTAWCLDKLPARRPASAKALAGALDRTGLRRPRLSPRTLAGLGLVCIALAVAAVGMRRSRAPVVPAARPVLAVLEAANLTGDDSLDWVSTAIPELLTSDLEPLAGMRLVPAGVVAERQHSLAVMTGGRFAPAAGPVRLAEAVGATYLAVVAFRRDGGRLSLDARVRRPRSDAPLATASISTSTSVDELERAVLTLADGLRRGMGWTRGDPALRSPHIQSRPLPRNADARMAVVQGIRSWVRYDFPEAQGFFRRAIELEPTFLPAFSQLFDTQEAGSLWHSNVEGERALDLLRSVPPSPEKDGLEASALVALKRTDEAAERLTTQLEQRPDDHELMLRRAWAASGSVSLEQLARMRALPPPLGKDPRIELCEVEGRESEMELPEAMQAADRGLAEARRRGDRMLTAVLLSDRAILFLRLGRLDEMVEAFRSAEQEALAAGSPAFVRSTRVRRAGWLAASGRSRAASELYRQILLEIPSLGEGWRALQAELRVRELMAEDDIENVTRVRELLAEIHAGGGDSNGLSGALQRIQTDDRLLVARPAEREQLLRTALDGCGSNAPCRYQLTVSLGGELLSQDRVKDAAQVMLGLGEDVHRSAARLYAQVMIASGRAAEAYATLQPLMRADVQLQAQIGAFYPWQQNEALASCLVAMGEFDQAIPLVGRMAKFHRAAEPIWIRRGGLALETELAVRRRVVPPELPGILQHELESPAARIDPRLRTELQIDLGRLLSVMGRTSEAGKHLRPAEKAAVANRQLRLARLARESLQAH